MSDDYCNSERRNKKGDKKKNRKKFPYKIGGRNRTEKVGV
jgi:hypothetical protein